ncbi:MAG: DUF1559 domain-containing protein [Gemmataceae bacterium]|nr:DUF1559 domain-containing protein [Gemmataceae bacterium]
MRAGAVRRRGGRAVLALLVGLLVGGWAGFGLTYLLKRNQFRGADAPAEANLPPADELKLVPADAAGFVHVRLADLWETEALAEFKKIVDKAGPDALNALDAYFEPKPSSLDRATLVVLKSDGPVRPRGGPGPGGFGPADLPFDLGRDTPLAVILAFSAPVDPVRFRQANLPAADQLTTNGKEYWVARGGLAAHFATDRTVILGTNQAVKALLDKPAAADGPLAPALKLAAGGGRHLVGGLNLAAVPLPPDLRRQLPAEVAPLLNARAVTVGLVVGSGSRFDLRASYADDKAAAEAEAAARAAAKLGRDKLAEAKKKLEEAVKGRPDRPVPRPAEDLPEALGGVAGLGALNMLDEWLADLPLRREGNELTASVTTGAAGGAYLGLAPVAVGLLLPAVQKVRESAARVSDSNNLKQIGLAFHAYHDTTGKFPGPVWGMENGRPAAKPGLSWRVALLPFLEQLPLYEQFKLNEPWDSDHNKKLIPLMPKVYLTPRAPAEPGMTYYKVFVGGGAAFDPDPKKARNLAGFTDGLSNTILVAEGGEPVVWTKPDDFAFDPKGPLPDLTLAGSRVINVLLADGSVRTVNLDFASEKTLKLAIQAADGMVLPADW